MNDYKRYDMSRYTEHMAIDQYGNTYHALGPHPRKELMSRIGVKHAERMFINRPHGGGTVQVGWVIGGLWCTVYRLERLALKP